MGGAMGDVARGTSLMAPSGAKIVHGGSGADEAGVRRKGAGVWVYFRNTS